MRQRVGGPLVMRDQLQHLLDVPKRYPNISASCTP
ncbi:Scr1 family TA system antitoxin-like transcriptional regulator [Kitasatospora purpeofusca]